MEEKKDWKEELQDIINREMFKEDLMIQIKSLVDQELDKAREEVLQRVLILEDADVNQEGEMTGLGTVHIDAILYEFEQDMKCWKKLSKLKTKEDEK